MWKFITAPFRWVYGLFVPAPIQTTTQTPSAWDRPASPPLTRPATSPSVAHVPTPAVSPAPISLNSAQPSPWTSGAPRQESKSARLARERDEALEAQRRAERNADDERRRRRDAEDEAARNHSSGTGSFLGGMVAGVLLDEALSSHSAHASAPRHSSILGDGNSRSYQDAPDYSTNLGGAGLTRLDVSPSRNDDEVVVNGKGGWSEDETPAPKAPASGWSEPANDAQVSKGWSEPEADPEPVRSYGGGSTTASYDPPARSYDSTPSRSYDSDTGSGSSGGWSNDSDTGSGGGGGGDGGWSDD